MADICVYTCITGGRDFAKADHKTSNGVDYRLYHDDWVGKIPRFYQPHEAPEMPTPRMSARCVKALSHEYSGDSEYSIWLDGSLTLLVPAADIIDRYLADHDMAAFIHPATHTLKKEKEGVLGANLDRRFVVEGQYRTYIEDGFPARRLINATGMIVRRHTKQVREFNELWWDHIRTMSIRDQMSFNYAAWKTDLLIESLPGNIYANELCRHTPHR